MGISGGMNFYYSINGCSLKDILTICRGESGTANPEISIDCNWVGNYLGRTRGDYVQKTVDVLSIFSRVGF